MAPTHRRICTSNICRAQGPLCRGSSLETWPAAVRRMAYGHQGMQRLLNFEWEHNQPTIPLGHVRELCWATECSPRWLCPLSLWPACPCPSIHLLISPQHLFWDWWQGPLPTLEPLSILKSPWC